MSAVHCDKCGLASYLPHLVNNLSGNLELLGLSLKAIRKELQIIDNNISSRVIDSCGYDPEKESKENLIMSVKALSDENEVDLLKLRKLDEAIVKLIAIAEGESK